MNILYKYILFALLITTTNVLAQDCTNDTINPTPVCLNGISIENITPNCIEIFAKDLLKEAFDDCSSNEYVENSVKIRREGDTEPPQDSIIICCSDLGTQIVEIWVEDEAGNSDYCTTYIIVQDNNNNCLPCNGTPLTGNISTWNNIPLENAVMSLNNISALEAYTDELGNYQFDCVGYGNYIPAITYMDDPRAGITVKDLIATSRHILGEETFTNFYQLLAADVNNDGKITTFDVVQSRQLQLYIIDDFPSQESWRFFQDDLNSTSINISTNNNIHTYDYTALKTGDVSGNSPINTNTLDFTIPEREYEIGDTVNVSFYSPNYIDILGFQFGLSYDTTALEFIEQINLNQSIGFFPISNLVEDGLLLVSANSITSIADNLSETQSLMEFSFVALQSGPLLEAIGLYDQSNDAVLFPTEAYNGNLELMGVQLNVTGSTQPIFFQESCWNRSFPVEAGTCEGFASMHQIAIAPSCADPTISYQYEIDFYDDGGIDQIEFDNDASDIYILGTHRIYFTATDACGNSIICDYLFEIKDNEAPTISCNDLFLEYDETVATIELFPSDFIELISDNCTDSSYLANNAVIGSFLLPTHTYTNSLTLDNTESSHVLAIEITDEAGNTQICLANLTIGNPIPYIAHDLICPLIWGDPNLAMNLPLEDIQYNLNLSGFPPVFIESIGTNNCYNLPLNSVLKGYSFIELSPKSSRNFANGVSTYDMVLMGQHLLNIKKLDNPYAKLAADVSQNNSISIQDLAILRALILYVIQELPSGDSWGFVRSDYEFENPDSPLGEIYPKADTIPIAADGTVTMTRGFNAFKYGDVNASAVPNFMGESSERSSNTPLQFVVQDQMLSADENFTVDFTLADASNFLGYQMSIQFDPTKLHLNEIIPGNLAFMGSDNFGTHFLDEGIITTLWNNYYEEGLAADEVLFSLNFTALENTYLSDILAINSRYTEAIAYNKMGERRDIELLFNTSTSTNELSNFASSIKIFPNPVQEEFIISSTQTNSAKTTLRLYTIQGQLIEECVTKNLDNYQWNINDLPNGVYLLQIESNNTQESIRLIKH